MGGGVVTTLDEVSGLLIGLDGPPVLIPPRLAGLVARALAGFHERLRTNGLPDDPELNRLQLAASFSAECYRKKMSAGGQSVDGTVSDPGCSPHDIDSATAAARLDVDERTVRRWAGSGRIDGHQVSRVWIIDARSVERERDRRGAA